MSGSSYHHLWQRNLDGTTLTLTSECETSQELASFLQACRENTTVRTVIFRESFLPLRRIRLHLTHIEFLQMLQAVCRLKSLVRIVIPATMPGMLRGVTASYFLPDWPDDDDGEDSADEISYDQELYSSNLQEWIANGALTLCTVNDVCAIADAIEVVCPKLRCLEIQHFYFKQFRTGPHKQQQQQADDNSRRDDGEEECLLDPLFRSLATLAEFSVLKLSCHPDYILQVNHASIADSPSCGFAAPQFMDKLFTYQCNTLKHLTLVRLALVDQHFQVIAASLPSLKVLETLDLNENAQTHSSGTIPILQKLSLVPPTHPLTSLSMKPLIYLETTSEQFDMDWTLIFPRNTSLQYLETSTINLRRGQENGRRSGNDDESDDNSNENQNHDASALVEFWLHLNRMHRSDWGNIAIPGSPLWPVLLERLGRYSISAQWHCLHTYLPLMHHSQ